MLTRVQATVSAYDPSDRSGRVLLDDGSSWTSRAGAGGQPAAAAAAGTAGAAGDRGSGTDLHVDRLQILTLH